MKSEPQDDFEFKTTPKKGSSTLSTLSPSLLSLKQEDSRDEGSSTQTKVSLEDREGPQKKSTPRKSNAKQSSNRRGPPHYDSTMYPTYPHPGSLYPPPPPGSRPPYAPHLHPHYGYDPHYRPPHPHHSYPPPPVHSGQGGGGGPGGGYSYGPPPPHSYHPHHPYGGYPAHMPYPPPPHPMPPSGGYPPLPLSSADNSSLSSSKGKSNNSKYSEKYNQLSRKKRAMVDEDHNTYSRTTARSGGSGHHRTPSNASSASTLSGGSIPFIDSKEKAENPLTRASPKRRRGHNSNPISVVTSFDENSIHRCTSNASTTESAARFQQLSVHDNGREDPQTSIFLTLSTSPIHTQDFETTPISKNKTLSLDAADSFMSRAQSMDSYSAINNKDRHGETPTPPMNTSGTTVLTDEHLLKNHLRGQTFTPVPPSERDSKANQSNSITHAPSNSEGTTNVNKNSSITGFAAVQTQLSWSIAGDAPSIGDLADWEEDRHKRPTSTTSQLSPNSRNISLSPSSFTMWKDFDPNNKHRTSSRDESLRLSMLSPQSMGEEDGGVSTPLPFFFSNDGGDDEERENSGIRESYSNASDKSNGNYSSKYGHSGYHHRVPENVHSIFVNRSGSTSKNGESKLANTGSNGSGRYHTHGNGRCDSSGRGGMRMAPNAAYSDHDSGIGYGLRHHGRDGPPEGPYYPPHPYLAPPPIPHHHMSDRVRNLRGRGPPHHHPPHHAPPQLQIPPPVTSHHTLTSPLGVPSKMWGIPHHSPHHAPPPPMDLNMNSSKRKCIALKPPIPSKFQGDIEKVKNALVPEFTCLVNFPAHMSQKQSANLPEGMRCCVMCGQACPCSTISKSGGINNSVAAGNNKKPSSSSSTSSSLSGKKDSSSMEKQSGNGLAIIPTQNKGLCTMCDVNVWVVCQSGLEIKWCKGCKNFRPWAAFGDKGLATKCLRCRERQREKYALQKEEKEKSRVK